MCQNKLRRGSPNPFRTIFALITFIEKELELPEKAVMLERSHTVVGLLPCCLSLDPGS